MIHPIGAAKAPIGAVRVPAGADWRRCKLPKTRFIVQQYRVVFLALVTAAATFFLWPRITAIQLSEFDFSQFWFAANQVALGNNPYTQAALLYPPWVIPFFLPFGFLTFNTSRWIWYFIQIGLLFWVFHQAWSIYHGPKRVQWVAWVVGFFFSATVFTLILGQLSLIVLAGVIVFLKCIEKTHFGWQDYLGIGLAGYLISLKPQTFYLFWIFWVVWVITHKQWRPFLASITGILGASVLLSAVFPDILLSYLIGLIQSPPVIWGTPTIGYWLRYILGEEYFGLQFIAPLLGVGWALLHWRHSKKQWRWQDQIPNIAFVTLLTAPYAWTHDYLILLPAIFQGLSATARQAGFARLGLYAVTWAVFNFMLIGMHFYLSDFYFIWQLPILFLFSWLPVRFWRASNAEIPPAQGNWSKM